MKDIKRRDFLKGFGLAIGGAAAAATIPDKLERVINQQEPEERKEEKEENPIVFHPPEGSVELALGDFRIYAHRFCVSNQGWKGGHLTNSCTVTIVAPNGDDYKCRYWDSIHNYEKRIPLDTREAALVVVNEITSMWSDPDEYERMIMEAHTDDYREGIRIVDALREFADEHGDALVESISDEGWYDEDDLREAIKYADKEDQT